MLFTDSMKIVLITGGLGNQMFSYAFFYVISKKYRFLFTEIDVNQTTDHHNGFELNAVFLGIRFHKAKYYELVKKLYLSYFARFLFKKVSQKDAGFVKNIYNFNGLFSIYQGFWQSELYFKEYEDDIRKLFAFNENTISIKNRIILLDIQACQSVSIHIRRGDYLGNDQLNNVCTLDYYMSAIQLISSKVTGPVYYLFSDDPEWVKYTFDQPDFIVIDWNENADSWQDMFLMSHCKHNIIANSTFSWWAAWLNNNDKKIVIAPKKWYSNADDEDIVPAGWLKI